MLKSAGQYNEYAKDYDEFSRTAVPWVSLDKPTIEKELVPILRPDIRVVELGCGGGKVMELLHAQGVLQKNMVGIDSSEGLLKLAKSHLPDSQFILEDISGNRSIIPDGFFDIAISVRALEYLTIPDLDAAMRNAFQALRSGGVFFIIVGHPLRVNNGNLAQYLERGWRTVSLPWGMKVELYHKTISDYVNASLKAGFSISLLDETKPSDKLKESDLKAYEKYESYGATNLLMVLKKD